MAKIRAQSEHLEKVTAAYVSQHRDYLLQSVQEGGQKRQALLKTARQMEEIKSQVIHMRTQISEPIATVRNEIRTLENTLITIRLLKKTQKLVGIFQKLRSFVASCIASHQNTMSRANPASPTNVTTAGAKSDFTEVARLDSISLSEAKMAIENESKGNSRVLSRLSSIIASALPYYTDESLRGLKILDKEKPFLDAISSIVKTCAKDVLIQARSDTFSLLPLDVMTSITVLHDLNSLPEVLVEVIDHTAHICLLMLREAIDIRGIVASASSAGTGLLSTIGKTTKSKDISPITTNLPGSILQGHKVSSQSSNARMTVSSTGLFPPIDPNIPIATNVVGSTAAMRGALWGRLDTAFSGMEREIRKIWSLIYVVSKLRTSADVSSTRLSPSSAIVHGHLGPDLPFTKNDNPFQFLGALRSSLLSNLRELHLEPFDKTAETHSESSNYQVPLSKGEKSMLAKVLNSVDNLRSSMGNRPQGNRDLSRETNPHTESIGTFQLPDKKSMDRYVREATLLGLDLLGSLSGLVQAGIPVEQLRQLTSSTLGIQHQAALQPRKSVMHPIFASSDSLFDYCIHPAVLFLRRFWITFTHNLHSELEALSGTKVISASESVEKLDRTGGQSTPSSHMFVRTTLMEQYPRFHALTNQLCARLRASVVKQLDNEDLFDISVNSSNATIFQNSHALPVSRGSAGRAIIATAFRSHMFPLPGEILLDFAFDPSRLQWVTDPLQVIYHGRITARLNDAIHLLFQTESSSSGTRKMISSRIQSPVPQSTTSSTTALQAGFNTSSEMSKLLDASPLGESSSMLNLTQFASSVGANFFSQETTEVPTPSKAQQFLKVFNAEMHNVEKLISEYDTEESLTLQQDKEKQLVPSLRGSILRVIFGSNTSNTSRVAQSILKVITASLKVLNMRLLSIRGIGSAATAVGEDWTPTRMQLNNFALARCLEEVRGGILAYIERSEVPPSFQVLQKESTVASFQSRGYIVGKTIVQPFSQNLPLVHTIILDALKSIEELESKKSEALSESRSGQVKGSKDAQISISETSMQTYKTVLEVLSSVLPIEKIREAPITHLIDMYRMFDKSIEDILLPWLSAVSIPLEKGISRIHETSMAVLDDEEGRNLEGMTVDSEWVARMETYVSTLSERQLSPHLPERLANTCRCALATRLVDLFVRNICLIKPLAQKGKFHLIRDCSQMEVVLSHLTPAKKKDEQMMNNFARLRALKLLLFTPSQHLQQVLNIPITGEDLEEVLKPSDSTRLLLALRDIRSSDLLHFLLSRLPSQCPSAASIVRQTVRTYSLLLDKVLVSSGDGSNWKDVTPDVISLLKDVEVLADRPKDGIFLPETVSNKIAVLFPSANSIRAVDRFAWVVIRMCLFEFERNSTKLLAIQGPSKQIAVSEYLSSRFPEYTILNLRGLQITNGAI